MTKRKIGVLLLFCFLGLGLGVQYAGSIRATRAFTANNLIRLHIIANSNEKRDQEVKYKVRDRVIEALRQQLVVARDCEQAREIVAKNRSHLACIARTAVAEEGESYPVRVELGRFSFPPKAYGSVVLPEGEYEAVRVVLGEGKGANWWCVLFPPLCFVDISGDAMQTQERGVVQETVAPEAKSSLENHADRQEENDPNLRIRFLEWLHQENGYLVRLFRS